MHSYLSERHSRSMNTLMLLCVSRRAGGRIRRLRCGAEIAEDLAGHEALQAADDLGLALPLGCTSPDVVEGGLVAAHAGDDDPVESGVGLVMSAAVEPMPGCLAARGRDRTGAAQLGKSCFAADPIGVIANKDQHFGRRT